MEVAVNEVTASSVSLLGVSNSKYAPTVTSDLAFFYSLTMFMFMH